MKLFIFDTDFEHYRIANTFYHQYALEVTEEQYNDIMEAFNQFDRVQTLLDDLIREQCNEA